MYKTKKQHRLDMLEKQADKLLREIDLSKHYSRMLSESIKKGIKAKKEREKLNKN